GEGRTSSRPLSPSTCPAAPLVLDPVDGPVAGAGTTEASAGRSLDVGKPAELEVEWVLSPNGHRRRRVDRRLDRARSSHLSGRQVPDGGGESGQGGGAPGHRDAARTVGPSADGIARA